AEARADDLVGRTLALDSGGAGGAVALQPLPEALVTRTASKVETQTYNDLAPPAAVTRRQDQGPRENVSPDLDTAPLPELEVDDTVSPPEEDPAGEPEIVPDQAPTQILRAMPELSYPGRPTRPPSSAGQLPGLLT